MDIWRLSHLFESAAGKVMVAFNADTMAWPCPWEDPVLALVRPEPDGIGDEGPVAEEARRKPGAEGA